MDEREAKEKVVAAGKRLTESGLIARTWGNVSCRISSSHFVITPSGRDYLSLTPDDIVTVAIEDTSYTGDIKPSSEKGVHAEIYRHSPDVGFIIHTHQENASVISALGVDSISTKSNWLFLEDKIICAAYGLPGTKKLRKGVADALNQTKGNAIIMRNHGAVCFGKYAEDAFRTASDLETACIRFIEEKYMQIQGVKTFDPDKMREFALSRIERRKPDLQVDYDRPYCSSERTADGFVLRSKGSDPVFVSFGRLNDTLPGEAKIHNEIYTTNRDINCILHSDAPDVLAISRANITLYPMVDDFAQIVGTKVKTVFAGAAQIADSLNHASAVLIGNNGALCCGANENDASAVKMILEKNCRARICAALFGDVKPLSRFDCMLMRFVYLKKYAKQINENKK